MTITKFGEIFRNFLRDVLYTMTSGVTHNVDCSKCEVVSIQWVAFILYCKLKTLPALTAGVILASASLVLISVDFSAFNCCKSE